MDHLIAELGKTQGAFAERFGQFRTITVELGYRYKEFCNGLITLAPELTGSRACNERSITTVYTTLLSSLEGLIEQGKQEGGASKDRERNSGLGSQSEGKG